MPDLDRKDALWMAILVALVLLFFHQFVFCGRIPLNADWLHANFAPGRVYLGQAEPHNSELDDPVYQFYPLRMEAVRQWKSGTLPLWNPNILCGTPLLADGIAKPLDPFVLLYFVFAGPVAHGLELLLKFIMMITGMYILARALSIPRAGAALAAVVYTFNLLSVTWMELRTTSGAFAFLPWVFVFLIAAMTKKSIAYAAAAGLAAALMQFAGHPQFVIYGFLLLAAYILWNAAARGLAGGVREGLTILALGAFAMILALAIAAVELVPFAELNMLSERSVRQYERSNLFSTPLSFLPYLYPDFFGNPAGGVYYGGRILIRPYMTATAGFVGASTLVFALAGAFTGRFTSKRFFALLVPAVVIFLVSVALGLSQFVPQIGLVVSGMDNSRIVFISNFALALLAGAGAGALAEAAWRDAALRRLAVVLALALVVVVVATACLGRISPWLAFGDEKQASPMRWFVGQVEAVWGSTILYPAVWTRIVFLVLAAVLLWLAPAVRRFAPPAAAGLVALELISAGINYNPFVSSGLVEPQFDVVKAVRRPPGEGRILGLDTPDAGELVSIKGDFLIPNTAILYGLEDMRGDQSLRLDRYQRYIRRIVGTGTSLLASTHSPVWDSPLINALNVKYILSAVPLESGALKKVFDDGKTYAYENLRAAPRAYLVGEWEAVATDTAALAAMCADAEFNPRTKAILEPAGASLPEMAPQFAGGDAVITAYAPSRVEIKTSCPVAAVLVLADAYYEGWRATVDGNETPVIPADMTLRAVSVPAGRHKVIFSYMPVSVKAGAAVSLAGLGVLALTLIVGRRREADSASNPASTGGGM